jgi:hypothetical protein
MKDKAACLKATKEIRARYGVEAADEQLVAALHLMNDHGADINAALDWSSRSGHDHGIDAWFYEERDRVLYVYQSKLTESKQLALSGLSDLAKAEEWLEEVLVRGKVTTVPSDNHCLYNLYVLLGRVSNELKRIEFHLVTPFGKAELEDFPEYQAFEALLAKSTLNSHIRQRNNGSLDFDAVEYNLQRALPPGYKKYRLPRIPASHVELRHNAHLSLAYVTLRSLVELYRQRGEMLFNKNIRLSLLSTKEGRERLRNPMEQTLDDITMGRLSPNIFPFYHTGVTIAAATSESDAENILMEVPSIINGCQTITIAGDFLQKLEKENKPDAIDLFNQIKVIAKVVVGTTDEELREVTNANNRQIPIEAWQLYSNEPIHIEIEAALKECGVFYERQKGKFATVMKRPDIARSYPNTNGAYIEVVELAQLVTLFRRNLQWAAKRSDVFVNGERHNSVFDQALPGYPRDMILGANLLKAMRRGLYNYLGLPAHADDAASAVLLRPLVSAYLFHIGMLHFYQSDNRRWVRDEFSVYLCKKASPRLVEETQAFYQKVVSKTKSWYREESKGLVADVSSRGMDKFFTGLAIEVGVDEDQGSLPFGHRAHRWD